MTDAEANRLEAEVAALKKALFQMQNAAIDLGQKLEVTEDQRDGAINEAAAAKRERDAYRLAVDVERELCAQVADAVAVGADELWDNNKTLDTAETIAAAIRSRSGT